ncbi:DNA translocase ftsK [Bacillus thuringiensis serovar pondicheriensis BGSC 4BA1]|nr:DNA translocase ftsK [Bacillus thuringiensis serovar pondicheriensis BGSC 4BA1]
MEGGNYMSDQYLSDEIAEKHYEEAKEFVIAMQAASVSMMQRRFRIGYMSAAKIIDCLEENGIIGPYEGSKPRKILIQK